MYTDCIPKTWGWGGERERECVCLFIRRWVGEENINISFLQATLNTFFFFLIILQNFSQTGALVRKSLGFQGMRDLLWQSWVALTSRGRSLRLNMIMMQSRYWRIWNSRILTLLLIANWNCECCVSTQKGNHVFTWMCAVFVKPKK